MPSVRSLYTSKWSLYSLFSFSSLVWFYNLFYVNGIKTISSDLEIFMAPLTLAIWICDDGGWTGSGVRIATNNYTLKEVEFLVDLLYRKFNLDCTIQKISIKDKYSIYFKSNSMKTLRNLILPYLHTSMHYKLGL